MRDWRRHASCHVDGLNMQGHWSGERSSTGGMEEEKGSEGREEGGGGERGREGGCRGEEGRERGREVDSTGGKEAI